MINDKIKSDNHKIFALLSNYLNNVPDYVNEEIGEIVECGVSYEYAFALILAAAFGLDIDENDDDRELFVNYFSSMFHHLDPTEYYANPYYKHIKIPTLKLGNSELKYDKYKPFEGFVCNDIIRTEAGRQIPQIGFFAAEFKYPAVFENGRLWMSVTPNEIETMKDPIAHAFGNVLTFGLGLGYYAYMTSLKDNVTRVTVVENNADIIDLFQKNILPQFQNTGKIRVIQADAFEYAQKHLAGGGYDFVFTDLWHDISDGLGLYLKMKTYESQCPDTVFMYWLEQSILCYL